MIFIIRKYVLEKKLYFKVFFSFSTKFDNEAKNKKNS